MRRFSEEDKLLDINKIISLELAKPTIRLISDINLSQEEFDILIPKLQRNLIPNFVDYTDYVAESLSVVMVYIAQNYYESGNYWSVVEKYFLPFKAQERTVIRKRFCKVCHTYHLPDFEEERQEGYKIITPIICHAGIPDNQLDHYFQIFDDAFENYDNSAWTDITEEISDAFNFKAPVYINRFLDALHEKKNLFIMQWSDVKRSYYDDITLDDFLSGIQAFFAEEEEVIVPERFLSAYHEWKNRPIEIAPGKRVKRVIYKNPRITLDLEGKGILLRLPPQLAPGGNSHTEMYWRLFTDQRREEIPCHLRKSHIDGKFYTEEKEILLSPTERLEVKLYSSENYNAPLLSWESSLLEEKPYLIFTSGGTLLDSNILHGRHVTFIVPEHYKIQATCQLAELPKLPYWRSYQVIDAFFEPKDRIEIIDRSLQHLVETFKITDNEAPVLRGGRLFFNNPDLYTSLPVLNLQHQDTDDWKMILRKSSGREEIKKRGETGSEIALDQFIGQKDFGFYELRIQDNKRKHYRLSFYYLPEVDISTNINRWPEPEKGYRAEDFYCTMPAAMSISFDQYEIQQDEVYEDRRRMKFALSGLDTKAAGRIQLTQDNGSITVPFLFAVHPLVWSLLTALHSDQVNVTDLVIRKDWQDFFESGEQYLLINSGDLGHNELQGKMEVYAADGRLLREKDIELKSWHNVKFNLSDVLFLLEAEQSHRATIFLSIFSPDSSIISKFPLLHIDEQIKVSNFSYKSDAHSLHFEWDEIGEQFERVMAFKSLSKPWSEDIIVALMDGESDLYIAKNMLIKGIYACSVEAPADKSPFGDFEYIPHTTKNTLLIDIEDSTENLDPLEEFNYLLMRYLLFDDLEKPSLPIPTIIEKADLINLAKTNLLVLSLRQEHDIYADEIIDEKFQFAINNIRRISRRITVEAEEIIRILFNENFSSEQINESIFFYRLNCLSDEQVGTEWSFTNFQKLTKANPALAFQVCMSTGKHLDWVVEWIGEHELRPLLGTPSEIEIIDDLAARFSSPPNKQKLWPASPLFWGSFEEYLNYFSFISKLPPAKTIKKNKEELLEEYEAKHRANTPKLFRKTYLALMQNLNTLSKEKNEDVHKLLEYENTIDNKILKELRQSYPTAMSIIDNRSDYDGSQLDDLASLIGLLVFLGVLYRHGEINFRDPSLIRHLARIQQCFPDFYYHDLVLFELFYLDGGR